MTKTTPPRRPRPGRPFRPIERDPSAAAASPQIAGAPRRFGAKVQPPPPPPARVYTFRPDMTKEEVTELIVAATDDPRCASVPDLKAARDMLKAAWAARYGFSEVLGAGWTALINGPGTDTVNKRLPGERGPVTMWAWMGSPFIRVLQPFATELTDEVRADMKDGAKEWSLDCRILEDEPGWHCPGRCLFVVCMLRDNWRGRLWQPWAAASSSIT
jgi:hypothetical protein